MSFLNDIPVPLSTIRQIPLEKTKKRRAPLRDRTIVMNKGKIRDLRKSVCVPCRYGIFEGQETVWSTDGLIHKWCKKESISEDSEQSKGAL